MQSMGVAYVQFKDATEAERARTAKHKANMGTRYVECLAYHPERCWSAFCNYMVPTSILLHEFPQS